jgi:hypothetical protein
MAFTDVMDLYFYACNNGMPKGFHESTRAKSVAELAKFVSNSMRSTTARVVCTDYHLTVDPRSTSKATAATFLGTLMYIYFNDGLLAANAQMVSDADANAVSAAIAAEQAAILADLAAEARVAAMVASFRASQATEEVVAEDGPKWYDDYSDDDSGDDNGDDSGNDSGDDEYYNDRSM